jgi:hypothetical protein
MDPFLEQHWGDVHLRLILYSCDALQPRLPGDLRARAEERVFVESEPDRMRHIIPDVRIYQRHSAPSHSASVMREESDIAVAEPIIYEVHNPVVTEGYIEIRERGGGKVVTVIEFLSPANKSGGAGQARYLEKQAEVLESDASLVEIDLVRAGRRVLAFPKGDGAPESRAEYLACISPGWKRSRRELYPISMRERLPVLPIPLRSHESAVRLDLQRVLDQAYAAGGYDDLDYSSELTPPLRPEDREWMANVIKNR